MSDANAVAEAAPPSSAPSAEVTPTPNEGQAAGAPESAQTPSKDETGNKNPLKDNKEFQGLLAREKELQEQAAFWENRAKQAKAQATAAPASVPAPVQVSSEIDPYKEDIAKVAQAQIAPYVTELQNLKNQEMQRQEYEWHMQQAKDIEATAAKYPDFWNHADAMNKLVDADPNLLNLPKENLYKMVAFDKTIEHLKANGKVEAIQDMQKTAQHQTPSGTVTPQATQPTKLLSLDEAFNEAQKEIRGGR